jgi:outer membrane protein insertion porin family
MMTRLMLLLVLGSGFLFSNAQEAIEPTAEVSVHALGLQVIARGVSTFALTEVKAVIEEQLSLAGDTTMTGPLADDLAFFLRQSYLNLGYTDATVAWEIANGTAVLHVSEGPRYAVGRIAYQGNTSHQEEELTAYLLRPTRDKGALKAGQTFFVEADLMNGATLVQRFLQAQGYLDAVVQPPIFSKHPETGTQDVLVKLQEGQRYSLGSVEVKGDLLGLDKEVAETIKDLSGQPYSEVVIESARASLTTIYQRRGHFKALVTSSADPAKANAGTVPVTFEVVPGQRYRIAGVLIDPKLSAGAQRLLRGSFKHSVGRLYSPEELELMHLRVLGSEVFSRLDLTPTTLTDDTLTLELTGEEGPSKTIAAYAGYETFQGPIIGAEARQVNIFDSGNSMQIKAELNGRGLDGSLKWLDPAIFESGYNLQLTLAAQTVTYFDYDRRSQSGQVKLGRQWTKNISTSVFGEVSQNDAESTELTAAELGPEAYNLGLVGASILFDYRDSPVSPKRGWLGSLSVTGAQGDVTYLRTDVVFSYYQPITKKFRAAFNARTSALQSNEGVEAVPIDLRLFNGGASSVRSFAEREMGEISDSGTPQGGTLSQVFSVELSYAIIPNLEIALFTDAGTLSRTEDSVFASPDDLRYAVGLGLRYNLPVGPLRIDYGYNPDRREGEEMGSLHITFGFAF